MSACTLRQRATRACGTGRTGTVSAWAGTAFVDAKLSIVEVISRD